MADKLGELAPRTGLASADADDTPPSGAEA